MDGTVHKDAVVTVQWQPAKASYLLQCDRGAVVMAQEELLGHQFTVKEATCKTAGGTKWSKKELKVACLRKEAGETTASVAKSLGRTNNSVGSRVRGANDPAYTPKTGGSGVKTGHNVRWRQVAAKALQQRPDCRGTTQEVLTYVTHMCLDRDHLRVRSIRWWRLCRT